MITYPPPTLVDASRAEDALTSRLHRIVYHTPMTLPDGGKWHRFSVPGRHAFTLGSGETLSEAYADACRELDRRGL